MDGWMDGRMAGWELKPGRVGLESDKQVAAAVWIGGWQHTHRSASDGAFHPPPFFFFPALHRVGEGRRSAVHGSEGAKA